MRRENYSSIDSQGLEQGLEQVMSCIKGDKPKKHSSAVLSVHLWLNIHFFSIPVLVSLV